jgi:hypothetical protein
VLKLFVALLIGGMLMVADDAGRSLTHPDYVPDEATAEQIAEAVLVGQFGRERVSTQLPLHTSSVSNEQWLVQGALKDKEGRTQVGGGFAVWVNKHSGCVSVVERMK